MEATRTSVTSGNEQIGYNMDPAYQVGYTQQEVDGKNLKFVLPLVNYFCGETRDRKHFEIEDFLEF